MKRLATVAMLAAAFAGGPVVAVGCGGAAGGISTERAELPPADPEAVEAFLGGIRLMKRGNVRGARRRFEEALGIDRNLWEAHYNLGVLDRQDGEMRQAFRHFTAARRIQPGATEPLLALAEVHYTMGNKEEAGDLLRAHIEDQPNAADARVALATILREEEDYGDALEQAREALIREPQNVQALIEVGRVYRAREQYDVANLVFQKALALTEEDDGPSRAELFNDLGLVALERGDTQAAFQQFALAVEADARFTPARSNQGAVLLNAGDWEGAANEYRAVLQIDEDNLAARVALGVAYRGAGQHQRAKREYEAVLDRRGNHPAALFNLAVLRAEFLNQRPQSIELFRRFLRVAPRSARRQREMAERYIQEIGSEGGGG